MVVGHKRIDAMAAAGNNGPAGPQESPVHLNAQLHMLLVVIIQILMQQGYF